MKATGELIHSNTRITARSSAVRGRSFGNHLGQVWQGFVKFLVGSSDPRIQKISADNWRVYDPATHQSLSFTSEQEVRIWLDERYRF